MGSKPTTKRIPHSILWIGWLWLVLFIASGGMILAGRAANAGRFGCLQRDAYIIDVSHNKDIILARGPILPDLDLRYPSPDGKTIAYLKYSNVQQAYNLTLSNVDGSTERKVIMKKPPNAFLGWSADGQYFETNSPDESSINRADIWSTATLQTVAHLDTAGANWSPVDHRLAYVAEDKLHVVNLDNKAHRIYSVQRPASFAYPNWGSPALCVKPGISSRCVPGQHTLTKQVKIGATIH